MARIKDLTGKTFNKLTAVKFVGIDKNSFSAIWEFQCDCGKNTITLGSRVAKGYTKSCGCALKDRKAKEISDITNKKFGRLTAIKPSDRRLYGRVTWICLCDCGKEILSTQNSLTKGNTSSCGCLHKETSSEIGRKNKKHDSGLGKLFYYYSEGAKRRKLSFSLTKEEFHNLTSQDCHYCGISPNRITFSNKARVPYISNGIDRKDNSLGYVSGNCLPCCSICNHAKHTLSYSEFVSWLQRAGKHQNGLQSTPG